MSSLIPCPGCTHMLTLPTDFIGRRVQCPKCAAEFQAQASATPALEVDPQAPPEVAPANGIPQAQPAPPLQTNYAHYKKVTRAPAAPENDDVPSLFCAECGTRYPRADDACPECGYRNFELLAERLGEHRQGRPRDLPPLHAWLAPMCAILVPFGFFIAFAGLVISDGLHRPGRPPFVIGIGMILLAGLAELVALALFLIWLYQAWRLVSIGDEEYSPALVVGLLVVPVFNFYWIFPAIVGLSSALQRELNHMAPRRPNGAGWIPGLITCIVVLIPYLQPVAACFFLAWLLIANHAARRLIRLHQRAAQEADARRQALG